VSGAVADRPREGWGWLPVLSIVVALGLLGVALADDAARDERSGAQTLFWLSLVVMFLPVALRALAGAISRREGLGLVLVLGLGLYLVKVLWAPTGFVLHDELTSLRTVNDILATGHTFDPNPIVSAYPFYPGLHLVTASLGDASGLGTFTAGLIVIGLARALLVGALFTVLLRVSGSPRVAAVGCLVYMGNPNFLFFTAQYAYESLALPMVIVTIAVVAAWGQRSRATVVLGGVLVAGVVLSHHMSAYAMTAALLGMTGAAVVLTRRRDVGLGEVTRLAPVAGLAVVLTLGWALFAAGGATNEELGPVFKSSAQALGNFVRTGSTGKVLFAAPGTGQKEALWATYVGFGSVGLVLVALPIGLWLQWRRRRSWTPLAIVVILAGAIYPLTLIPRLTAEGTEISNRASEFVFVGVGLLVAMVATGLVSPHGRRRWLLASPLAAAVTAVFLGGFIIGSAPYARLPGPYLPGGEERSVDVAGRNAARWLAAHVRPGTHVAADRVGALLASGTARVDPQSRAPRGVNFFSLLTDVRFDEPQRQIIRDTDTRYVVSDLRNAERLPAIGYYFHPAEPLARRRREPIRRVALLKYGMGSDVSRVFDSGDIVVFDTSLIAAQRRR